MEVLLVLNYLTRQHCHLALWKYNRRDVKQTNKLFVSTLYITFTFQNFHCHLQNCFPLGLDHGQTMSCAGGFSVAVLFSLLISLSLVLSQLNFHFHFQQDIFPGSDHVITMLWAGCGSVAFLFPLVISLSLLQHCHFQEDIFPRIGPCSDHIVCRL